MASDKAKRPRGTGSVYLKKGSAIYWIKYYRKGNPDPIRESTRTDKIKLAEKILAARMAESKAAEIGLSVWVSPQDKRTSVADLYQALLDDYKANGFRLRDNDARWRGRMEKFFPGVRAMAVTTDMLNRYVNQCREQGLSNATVNRDMAALRRAFNLAKRSGKIQTLPFFPHLKEAAPRKGFVEESDYQKLARHAGELWMRSLLATAYTFGFRKGELLGLKVYQVDLASRIIRLNAGETKSGDGRTVSMTQDVYTLLSACVSGKGAQDSVFTRPDGSPVIDFRKAWEKLTDAAGLPGLLFHDLRRSGVRNMIRRGIPEVVAMRISGHKTRSVFDRYNIVSENDLREAARKIEAGKQVWAPDGHDLTESANGQQSATAQTQLN